MPWVGLIAAMLAGGCGPKEPEPLDVAVVGARLDERWRQMEHGAKAAAEEATFTIEAFAPEEPEAKAQIEAIEGYLQRGVRGIAFAASDPDAMVEVIRKATAQGVACVTLDTDAPGTDRFAFVTAGDEAMGFAAGRAMVKALTGRRGEARGEVMIVTRSGSDPNLRRRVEGFAEVMRREPGIAVVDTVEHQGDAEASRGLAASITMQYRGLSAFYATDPASAVGCVGAVEQLGREGEIKIVCVGGTVEIMRRIQQRSIIAAVAPRHYLAGKQAVNLLWTIITKGEERALKRLPENRISEVGADLVTAGDLPRHRAELRRLGLAVDF